MRKKYFFLRNMSTLSMCILTFISGVLALILAFSDNADDVYFVPWSFFGDTFVPLMFFVCALWFRNRSCAIIAILLSFFNIFLRTASIVMYKEAFLTLDIYSIKLLWEHCDGHGLKAILGEKYLSWLLPLVFFIIAAVIYLCIIIWRSSGKKRKQLSRKWNIAFLILFGLAAVSNISYIVSNKLISIQSFYTGDLVKPLPFGIFDMAKDYFFPYKHKMQPLSPESEFILRQHNMLPEPADRNLYTGKHFDKIIIIAVESLDYNFIAAKNPQMPREITPTLDRLVREYPSMNNYYSATQPTSWGLTALIMSRMDYKKEQKYRINESIFTIARKRGYGSYYFAATSGSFGRNREGYRMIFNPDKIFFLEEWERYYSKNKHSESGWGLSDSDLYDGVLRELRHERKSKFVAVVSTIDTHTPYCAPELSCQEKQRYTTFLAALHSADRALGKFLQAAMSDPWLYNENTLIIITADHSATQGENYLRRTGGFAPDRIPLIFITPRKDFFNRIKWDKFASSIDLAPTLVQLIGGEIPQSFMGRTLFSNKNLALTWMLNYVMRIHSPDENMTFSIKVPPQSPVHRAFHDFFWVHNPDI